MFTHIDILTGKAVRLKINVHDLNGKQLLTQTVQIQQGSNYISVDDVSGLSQGIYLLSVTSNENTKTFKVIKMQ